MNKDGPHKKQGSYFIVDKGNWDNWICDKRGKLGIILLITECG